ncbi:branched-chain amino acid transport system permease protein [Kineococcus radiotolerans]|uniref:Inner-membrane translocator n=2 Tax=Kineococcus radiotolerans TaxID=131568 RepID=A6WC80_KINRD|nr:branched-chain amino acid ABC transporter permease [Kineococcus radiotolerans]ABS04419.1 inner-membrane translocator [Kineococcus radiotolerans SRS30216 = ATCC BAA-149]MBB2902907.1 branched-chain amino acid transport system permease protein [Kineococcus radiotolerans]
MSTSATAAKPARPAKPSFADRWTALPKPVQVLVWVLLALFFFVLPLLNLPIVSTPDAEFGSVLASVANYALVALGLNIVLGYAGLLDLGYVGFYAIGAYTVGVGGSLHGEINWFVLIIMAVTISTASGLLLGAPTLRVRGDYLAIVTLGFGEIIRLTALNTEWLNQARGITGIPRPPSTELFGLPSLVWDGATAKVDLGEGARSIFLKFGLLDAVPYYWLALIVIILVLIADKLLQASRVGRAWEATREDEEAAELNGVPTFRFKLLAFAMGAFVGGLSGALYASRIGAINPDSFMIQLSMMFLAAVVIGGQGNRWGAIVGGVVVAYLPERFREFADFRIVVFGLLLLLLANFRPQGLLPPRRAKRAQRADAATQELEGTQEGARA